ncbi:MAG TPA: hypothetical protein VGQ57_17605, partial [Polyangiaceae bacterium]|nr:hypothetical protein [Polyangiaceae bacterium]
RGRYAYTPAHPIDEFKGKMAWFSDYEGNSGTLSLAAPNPHLPGTDDQRGGSPYSATPIARGVYVNRHGFLNDLPGFVYLTRFDEATRTGELDYSNTELGFSSIVSDGVADYEQPGSGLLYSVPFGEGAGIWLARAK